MQVELNCEFSENKNKITIQVEKQVIFSLFLFQYIENLYSSSAFSFQEATLKYWFDQFQLFSQQRQTTRLVSLGSWMRVTGTAESESDVDFETFKELITRYLQNLF
mgnify:CR=1 FL=1